MNKRLALLLILILTVSSLIVVKPTHSSITKPSVPEFTVKLVDRSYDVPTTYSIDPYTGENVTHAGYHVENYTIEITIKNQPFTSYWVMEGTSNWTVYFYYNVRFKGHYTEDWMIAYNPGNEYPKRSNSTYTVLTYTHSSDDEYVIGGIMTQIHPGAQVDFQVQALIGYVHRGYNPNATDQLQMWPWIFTGETSDWSNTQTITIGTSTPTATPNTSPSPSTEPTPNSNSEPFPTTLVIVSIGSVAIVGLGLLVYLKKRQKGSVDKGVKLES